MDKGSGQLVQKTLGEGLFLPQEGYAIFKDYASQLEYIRSCRELWEKGLYVELGGYQRHVFMDWRFVADDEEKWNKVYRTLNGAGIPSIRAKWDEVFGVKDVEEEKPKKPTRKRTAKKVGEKKGVDHSRKKKSTPVI